MWQCDFGHIRQHCTSGNIPPRYINHELIAGKGEEDTCYIMKLGS